ncbi:DUF6199 family natural product biosynthesis protein [Paenibacillus dendritiformis]|uniref:DUF6199 family natural product biosynthesis protein n=1 Tax=Paenibacillus dendritiformis TaxID=130049 RepID=UPI000DAABC43|nr:DUF6199 family natural product biosynthesis protein [Paenibacillus dendritiformis]PZM66852.1 hypothetical protein DOE73_04505 [Paenibacillus dendritiformis]
MIVFCGLIAIAIGFLNIFKPSFAWYLKEGWKVNGDSEPSDTYLTLTKLGGVVVLIMGVVLVVAGIFNS